MAEDDYDFVEKPSEDFYCPVTFDLLREPHQMLCCGNHLSQEAATRLQGQPCPVCKESNLNTMPDKYFKRRVNEFKVRCPNKCLGCEWVGELGNLDRHLSQNSVEGECQFVTVACPYSCGDSFQRCQLQDHKMNNCPNRPFTCQYCDYEATYTEITTEHWPDCEKYPMQCPNACEEGTIERQHLEEHLDEMCPLQVVECEFSYAGCEVQCQRQHMQDHVNEKVKAHLSLVSEKVSQQLEEGKELDSRIKELEDKIEEQDSTIQEQQTTINQQIVAIASALTQVAIALDMNKLVVPPVFVPLPDIVMTDFKKHKIAGDKWYSPPFYSHIGGYKMCLCVDANGDGSGEATHVSVFCCLNRGEYDDQLKWPFRGDITIQLLNQIRDEGHWEISFPFHDKVPDDTAGRVVGKERASGRGYRQCIPHTELNTENKQYLKNNCLKFRISTIAVKSV